MIIGNRATNELRFSHVGEDRVDGNLAYMGIDPANYNTSGWINDLEYVGLNGRDQFDIGSLNGTRTSRPVSPPRTAAPTAATTRSRTRSTYVTGGGDHTLKTGFTYNRVMVRPQRIGANDNGTFEFQHNLPFSPANAFTYRRGSRSCWATSRSTPTTPGRTGSSRTSGG